MIAILILVSMALTGAIFVVVMVNATSEWARVRFVDRVLHEKIPNAYRTVQEPTDATSIDPRRDDEVRHSYVATLNRVLVSDYLASEAVWLAVEQTLAAGRRSTPESNRSSDGDLS
jgi:hypothetical protein